jgi:hypothetical protein
MRNRDVGCGRNQRQIRMFHVPAVMHIYPDSPDYADGRTLIIGGADEPKRCAHGAADLGGSEI